MKLCTDVITVYNRYTNKDKIKEYVPTIINDVHWFGTEKVTVTADGLVSAKQYTIRIPIEAQFQGKEYVPPKEYAKLSDRTKFFTLDEGDIIVKGSATEQPTTPSKLSDMYNDVITIISVTDNRSAPNAKHWKVVCK